MEELTIEEKAKRYDEAIDKAKKELDACGSQDCDAARQIFRLFSELKESEDEDERIRKALTNGFNKLDKSALWYNGITNGQILAWLEKQGEPTDINPSEFDLHLNKLLKQFETLPKEELASSLSFYLNVVQNDGTYREEKQGEQKPQRMISAEAKEAMYGNPTAWSEEDEERIKNILSVLDAQVCWHGATGKKGNPYQKEIDWLKSLRLQKQWKPSEMQIMCLQDALSDYHRRGYKAEILETLLKQLKQL